MNSTSATLYQMTSVPGARFAWVGRPPHGGLIACRRCGESGHTDALPAGETGPGRRGRGFLLADEAGARLWGQVHQCDPESAAPADAEALKRAPWHRTPDGRVECWEVSR